MIAVIWNNLQMIRQKAGSICRPVPFDRKSQVGDVCMISFGDAGTRCYEERRMNLGESDLFDIEQIG